MSTPPSDLEWDSGPARPIARWRRWLFNRLAQWEEASLARSLGLPVERVTFVDAQTALRSAGLRPPDAIRASDPS